MTNHSRGPVMVLLRSAGLLAGMLAVIAGLLSMHIMTGDHDRPQVSASPGMDIPAGVLQPAVPLQDFGTANAGRAAVPDAVSRSVSALELAAACASPDPCTAMSAMDAVCVPSPADTIFAAPLPGGTPFAPQALAGGAVPVTQYSYLPGSPSPCDLCISRT